MLDDHSPDQYPGVQGLPPGLFWGIVPVEKAYQVIPGNLCTQHDPTVGRVELVVKGGPEPGERKLAGAGVFTAWCTPFGVPLHSSLHLYPIKFRKIILNTDSSAILNLTSRPYLTN
jgi:hypothetical protein